MVNNNAIAALEACKKVLIDELKKYLESKPGKRVKCNVILPIYANDTYGLDGYWDQYTVTELYLDDEGRVYAIFEDYDEQFEDPLDECFIVGEIAKIVDRLD